MKTTETPAAILQKANEWLTCNYDEKTRDEVRQLINNEDNTSLIDAFYRDLEFGTGGLRGIMGVGSNRMNNLHRRRCNPGAKQLPQSCLCRVTPNRCGNRI